mgnify:FL=1
MIIEKKMFSLILFITLSMNCFSKESFEMILIVTDYAWLESPCDITPENFDSGEYLNNLDTVIISNEKDKRKIIHSIKKLKKCNNSNFYKNLDTRGKFIINHKRDGYASLYFGMNFMVKEGCFYKLSKELKRLIDRIVYLSKNHKPFDGRY